MCKKYRMKKCLAGLAVFSMMMAFSACGKNEGPDLTKTVTATVRYSGQNNNCLSEDCPYNEHYIEYL